MKRIEHPIELKHRIDVNVNTAFVYNEGYGHAFIDAMKTVYAADSAFRERMVIEVRALVLRKLEDELNRLMPDANVKIDIPRCMPMPVEKWTSIR